MLKTIKVTAKYVDDDVYIKLQRYHDGSIALRLMTITGEPVAIPTVCLSPHKEKPKDGYVFIRDYGENEGMLQGLQDAGIIGPPIRSFRPIESYVDFHECEFLLVADDSRVNLG